MSEIQSSYESVAETYAARFHDELRHKPFDRKVSTRAPISSPESKPKFPHA